MAQGVGVTDDDLVVRLAPVDARMARVAGIRFAKALADVSRADFAAALAEWERAQ